MESKYSVREKVEGTFVPTGEEIKFNKKWSSHEFSEDEIKTLLNGDPVSFTATSVNTGNDFDATGKLEEQEFNGHKFWGFKPDFAK